MSWGKGSDHLGDDHHIASFPIFIGRVTGNMSCDAVIDEFQFIL